MLEGWGWRVNLVRQRRFLDGINLKKGGQDRYMEKMCGYNTIVFRF